MCGRFTNKITWREIHDAYGAFMNAHPPWGHYNNAPMEQARIVVEAIASGSPSTKLGAVRRS